MKLALCGNPNVGKTTLFNRLTHSDAPVGNWHGVTVDVRTKRLSGEKDILLSDLPGAYSLTARTREECVTRDGILFDDYDAVVFVADVNNLRRNLYLLMQILESGKKTVLLVNMLDEASGKVDLRLLSDRLGIPVIGTSEKAENPKRDLINAVKTVHARAGLPYANNREILGIVDRVRNNAVKNDLDPLFAALKIAENDKFISEKLGCAESAFCNTKADLGCGNSCGCKCGGIDKDLPARLRYAYIDSLLIGVVENKRRNKITADIDKIILGKFALPIFFAVMSLVFVITYYVGKPISDLLERITESAVDVLRGKGNMPLWVNSLICDGIIGGVGAVLVFLPQVTLLFLLTSLLQDSGYMSRVAFVTDGFFNKFGLSGRAAFSLILGLGCSATAVLSARGIADRTAQKRTAFVTPFCPCSARLAVFTAVSAYLGLNGLIIAVLYLLGFSAALVTLKIMQLFKKSDRAEELLMEMPPYRLPRPRRVLAVVWNNVVSFIARVGSVVLCVNVIMWILSEFSVGYGFTGGGETSIMCTLSGMIAPVFAPLGFGNWKAVAALLSGVAAKETVISVIASLGGIGEVFGSTAAAVSFMIFTCLYVPCVATLAALAKENGKASAALSVAVHTVAAYCASLVYYQSAMCYYHDKLIFFIAIAAVAAVAAVSAGISVFLKIKRRKSAIG